MNVFSCTQNVAFNGRKQASLETKTKLRQAVVKKRFKMLCVLLLAIIGVANNSSASNNYTISSSATGVSTVTPGSSALIYSFLWKNTGTATANLSGFTFTTTGNVTSSDISSYSIYLSSTASLTPSSLYWGNASFVLPGVGTATNTAALVGSYYLTSAASTGSYYILIVANFATTAANNHYVTVGAQTATLTFSTGTWTPTVTGISGGSSCTIVNNCNSTYFSYLGLMGTYTVPAGCNSLVVTAAGAQGGSNSYNGTYPAAGGLGGLVTATVSVSSGAILDVFVGGRGSGNTSGGVGAAGGYNGGGTSGWNSGYSLAGGGGGGATDVSTSATLNSSTILVCAGGGGGAGLYHANYNYERGGAGGGNIAGGGYYSNSVVATLGATQTTGGSGGYAAGTANTGANCNTASSVFNGGGGGGYFGGSAGVNEGSPFGSGGGGGSSYITGTASATATNTQGVNVGNGYVVITPLTTVETVTPTSSTACSTAGVVIGLTASQAGVSYQLYLGATPVGSPVAGSATGAAINFATVYTSGTYSVTGTPTCGGTATAMSGTAVITINTPPTLVSPTVSSPVCVGSAITFAGGVSGVSSAAYSYSWAGPTGVISAVLNPTVSSAALVNAGNYTLTVTTASCSGSVSGSTSALVVGQLPTVVTPTVTPNPVCAGVGFSLNGSSLTGPTGALSYSWSGPTTGIVSSTAQSTTVPAAVTANAGSFTLTVTALGCAGSVSGNTNTNPLVVGKLPTTLTATVSPNPVSPCTSFSLTATTAGSASTTYLWTGPGGGDINNPTLVGSTTNVTSAGAADGGVYTLTATASGCGSSAAYTSSLTVTSPPALTSLSTSTSICYNASIDQTANFSYSTAAGGAYQYKLAWSSSGPLAVSSFTGIPASNIPVTVPMGTAAGIYTGTLTVQNSGGCSSNYILSLTVSQLPTTLTATVSPATVCAGTTINMTSTVSGGGGYNLLWTGGASTINSNTTSAANISSTVLGDAGVYTLTATAPACGSASVTATTSALTVNQLPATITATVSPTPVCAGSTISLGSTVSGGGGYTLLWTGGTSTINNSTTTAANITTAALTDNGVYTLTATATACSGSTSGVTSSLAVNKLPTAFTATVSPNPGCIGSPVSLTATATGGSGVTYLWTGQAGGTAVSGSTSITAAGIGSVASADAGVYTVTASAAGCSGTASALTSALVLYSNPTVTATVSTVTACVGTNITLSSTGSGATAYLWSGPGGTAITLPTSSSTGVAGVNAGNAGVYTLTASNAGCSVNAVTSFLTVTSAPLPITGYSSVIVGGTMTLADATTGGTWSTGSGSIATVTTGTVTGVSSGTVTIAYTTGCGSASENINVYTSCGTTSLYAQSSATTATDGMYLESFVMTGACGTSVNQTSLACNLSGTDYSNYTTLTPVQLYPNTVYPATLKDGGLYLNYMTAWIDFNDDGTFSSTEQIWVNTSGTPGTMAANFVIPAIGTNGCSYGTHRLRIRSSDGGTMSTGCVSMTGASAYGNTDDFLVSIVPATPTLTSNSPVCTAGGTLTFTVSPSVTSGATYAFSGPGGYTANIYNVNTTSYSPVAGTYSVNLSVNGVSSCPAPGTTTVSTFSAPVAISGSPTVCVGATTLLTDGTTGGTWASVNPAIASISTGGTVTGIANGSATFSYSNGCGTAPTLPMTVNSLPVIVGATSICTSSTETLTATPTGGSWASSTPLIATVGSSSGVLSTFTTTGNSITTYTSLLGCVGSNTVTVTSSGGPSPLSGTFTVCPGTYTITSTPSGGIWSSSNPSVASIDPTTGIVTAILTGTTTMSYSEGCGAQTHVFSVNASSAYTTVTATEDNLGSNPLSFTGGSAYSTNIYSVTATLGGVTNTLGFGTDYSYTTSGLTLIPHASTIDNYLNQAGVYTINVYATGYCTAILTQSVSAGAAAQMYQATSPTGPTYDGYSLAVQPKIGFADQYGNHTTTFASGTPTVTAAAGAGSWTIGGTQTVAAAAGFVTYTSLTATSPVLVTTATVTYTSTSGIAAFTATPTFTITPGSFTATPNPITLPTVYAGTGLGAASTITLSETGILPGSTFTVTPSADFEVYNPGTSSWVAYPSSFTASSTGTYTVAFNAPSAAGSYTESVTFAAANATTYSLTCQATATAAYTVPFFEGFEGDAIHAMPTQMQGTPYTATTYYEVDNGAMYTAGYIVNPAENGAGMYIVEGLYETGGATYNWLGTKGLQLTGGTQYTFQVYYQQDYNSYANYLSGYNTAWLGINAYFTTSSAVPSTSTASVGTAITGATVGLITNDSWQTLRGTFTPPSSGIYYIDVCAHSNTQSFWLAFDDFAVCQVPTVTATATGAANPICNGATLVATVTPSASFLNSSAYSYSWSGTGGVTGTGTTVSAVEVNTTTATTYANYSVTVTSDVANTCSVTATLNESVTPTPSASFSYAGSPYCSTAGTATVTLGTGASAGAFTYSGTGTLSISPTTGAVNLSASTAGTYTVTNSVAASGGCSATAASTIITINHYNTTAFSYSGPYCTSGGTVSPTFTGGGVASAFTVTPVTGLTLNGSTGNITLSSSAAGTYTVTNTSVVAGCATSASTATVTVNGAVNVTTEPGNASVITGGTATYTVVATGTGLTYQWWEDIGGGSMSPIITSTGPYATGETYSGYNTSNVLSVANTNTGMNGYNYFCVVSGATACGAYTTTPEALLNVGANSFTLQPTSSVTGCPGAVTTATLTAGTYTTPTNIYWLEKVPGGSFTLISGTTTPGGVSCTGAGTGIGDGTFTFTLSGLTTADNGFQYECEIDGSVYSSASTITVNTPVSITTPPSALSMCTSGTGTFSVVVAGTSPTYVWNVSTNGGSTWNPVSGTVYTGTATATLTITNPTSAMSGYMYECVIGGASPCAGTTSAPATLTVTAPAVITSSPTTVTTCNTGVGTFTVAASGGTSYQWFVNSSGIWSALSDGGVYSGSGTATLTITNPPTAMNSYQYECVVGSTSPCSSVTSGAATLNVSTSPLTVSVSTPSPLCIGGTTTLSAVATCSPATITNTVVAINFSSGFTGTTGGGWTAASGPTNTSTSGYSPWTAKAASTSAYPGGGGTGDYFQYINPSSYYAITQATYIAGVTDRTLTSPAFSLAGGGVTDAVVNFGQYYYKNSGDTYASVEVSTDGGSTWSVVTNYASGSSLGNSTTFAPSSVDLAAYCGNANVKVRFHYITNGSSTTIVSYWWAINNVNITTIQTPIYTYAWSGPATIGSPSAANTTVTPPGSSSSVYGITVAATNMTTCSATTSYTVTPSALPALSYTASPTTICKGSATSLTVTPTPGAGTLTYGWSGPGIATVASSSVAPTSFTPTVTGSPNVYTITATYSGSGCGVVSVTPSINVQGALTVTAVNNGPICVTGSVNLTSSVSGGSGTYTYSWLGDAGSGVTSPVTTASLVATPTTSSAHVYTLTVTSTGSTGSCASAIATTTVTTNALPTATISSAIPSALCVGNATTLTAGTISGGGGSLIGYVWNGSDGSYASVTTTTVSFTPTTTTTYSLTVSEGGGCIGTTANTITVTANPQGVITLTATPTAICVNGTTSISSTITGGYGPRTYAWAGPGIATTTNSVAAPSSFTPTVSASPGVYTVTVNYSDIGCAAAIGTVSVTVYGNLTVTPTNGGLLCPGGTTALNSVVSGGSGAYTYAWSGTSGDAGSGTIAAASSASTTATPTTAGAHIYSLSVSTTGGCAAVVNTTTVTVSSLPVASITSAIPGILCAGTATITPNYTLGAGSVANYVWTSSDGSLSTTAAGFVVATPTATTTYSVTVNTTGSACIGTSAAVTTVTVNPQPSATVTPSSLYLCTGSVENLTSSVTGGVGTPTYTWSGPGITGTTATGATATYSLAPSASTGSYSLAVSYSVSTGCVTAAATTASVNITAPGSVTSLTPSSTALCSGGTLTLTATETGGSGTPVYTWNGPGISTTTSSSSPLVLTPTVTVSQSAAYSVTVGFSGGGCGTSAITTSSVVAVNIQPTVSVSALPLALCATGTLTLTTTSGGGAGTPVYTWSGPGITTATGSSAGAAVYVPTVSTGAYSVSVNYSGTGCNIVSGSSVGVVTVSPAPTVSISASTPGIICIGMTETLTATPSGGGGTPIYTWSGPGITGTTIAGSPLTVTPASGASAGVYSVQATYTVAGCNTVSNTTGTVTPTGQQWAGTTSTSWSDATNWACGIVPTATQDVVIPASTPHAPTLDVNPGYTNNLTVNSTVALTLGSGNQLDVAGNMVNNGSVTGAGVIYLNGGSSQSLSGNGTVSNLTLANSAGAVITNTTDIVGITGTLLLNSGTLSTYNGTTYGKLRLVSNASGSGCIGTVVSGTVSGTVEVQQYVPGGRRAYRFVAHPFSASIPLSQIENSIDITGVGGSTNGFTTTTSNSPSAYWYNTSVANSSLGSDPGWTAFTNTNGSGANAFNKDEGIRLYFRGAKGTGLDGSSYVVAPVTYTTSGTVNIGPHSITLVKGTAGSYQDYNLIGNPYPAVTDIGSVINAAGSAITGTAFYVWNPYLGTSGQFVAETIGGSYYLGANESFEVRTAANGNALNFTESNKGTSVTDALMRATSSDYLTLYIYDESYHPWDLLHINFNASATDNEDSKYDGAKPPSPASLNFYSLSADNSKLSIDARPFDDGKVIPLGIKSSYLQDFIIKAQNVAVPDGNQVYLHDKYLQTYTQLQQGTEYKFTISKDAASQGDSRFELSMKKAGATVAQTNDGLDVQMVPNPATNVVTITYSAPAKAQTSVRVMDVEGVTVLTQDLGIQQNGSTQIALDKLASGVYMVEITSGTQKVVHRLVKE